MTNPRWRSEADSYVAHLQHELRQHLEGRRFVVFGGPIVAGAGIAAQLRSLGGSAFVLGSSPGTGPLPDPDETPWAHLGVRGRSIMDDFWIAERSYPKPPARIQRAVDRFDPEGTARSAAIFTMTEVNQAAGRRRFGNRRRRWLQLEDKTRVEAFWRAIGAKHAPSRVVGADPDALRRAAAALDRGAGTVWAEDASRGNHGGGEGTHWVEDRSDAIRLGRRLARRVKRVRVMPFLTGTPCSIHGIVLPGFTVVLRPVEMVQLREVGRPKLRYAGVGTFWDPPERDRVAMRRLARRVGEAMRDRVGFRGPFTIDGVLSEDGFLPTEINTRQGGALGDVLGGVAGLPLAWMSLAAIEGLGIDWRPRRMQRVLLEAADRRRGGRGIALLPEPQSSSRAHALARGVQGLRRARNRQETESTLIQGPATTGTFLGWAPDPRHVPMGSLLAPRVVEAFAWADRVLGTSMGPLEPTPGAR
jgi:hypothetical protein